MKKLFLALSFIIPLVIWACVDKKPKPKDCIEESVQKPTVHNFLNEKLYHYTYYYDEQDLLKTFLHLVTDRLDEYGDYIYGEYISFPNSRHYQIYNTAPCGSGCFFMTFGKYYLSSDNELVMILDSTAYYRACDNEPTIYGDGSEKRLKIIRTKNDSTIQILEPIDNDLSNR